MTMTDEQLTRMARRVLGLVAERRQRRSPLSDSQSMVYATQLTWHESDDIEAAAVAILREEMGKWPECPKCKKDVPVWTTSKGECDCGMRYEDGRFSDDHIIHAAVTCCCVVADSIADDPTQTIVIDT
jgi:hypothetical protein